VRKPSAKNKEAGSEVQPKKYVSPFPKAFSLNRSPEDLKREVSTRSQTRMDSETLIFGENDALPLIISQAVDDSPAATACIDTIAQFIKGAGFSKKELEDTPIDKEGTTLWDFHCALADSLALFWGFAVNFKFNKAGKITKAFNMSFESTRFKKPTGDSAYITTIVHNPYFGTDQYKAEYTKEYPVFDIKQVGQQISELDSKEKKDSWGGQVYYYGKTSPLHRFYPVPKYWSAKKWIEVDGKIQNFHAENLENGFFQSVLMQMVGDPAAWSKNPRLMVEETGTDGVKRKRSTKTVGEEFNEQMSETFSGFKKAGTVFVQWLGNEKDGLKIQNFPTNTNADLFTALQDLTTKNITIGTRVPSILANISEGVSLGSAGSEIQKAIELMQARTKEWRNTLEGFYNKILLPNLEKPIQEKIEIVDFNPVSETPTIEDNIWQFLNEAEKIAWIRKNMQGVDIIRAVAPSIQPVIDPASPTPAPAVDPAQPPAPAPTQVSEALRNLNMAELNKVQKIVARYNLSLNDPANAKSLTYEQAKQLLMPFGFSDEEINAWLVKPDEL
jgi:hypothetical protein